MHTVFVITYNLLSTTKKLVEDIKRMNGVAVLMDNQSTYPPMLEWFKEVQDDPRVLYVKLPQNFGPRVVHYMYTTPKFNNVYSLVKEQYKRKFDRELPPIPIITDCDIDISEIPDDGLDVLSNLMAYDRAILKRYKKIGFSLRIDDLPNFPVLNKTKTWEAQFFTNPSTLAGVQVYANTLLDTTFQAFNPKIPHGTFFGPAIRTGSPYVARHIPWYWDPDNLGEEETYYLKNLQHLDVIMHSKDVKFASKL